MATLFGTVRRLCLIVEGWFALINELWSLFEAELSYAHFNARRTAGQSVSGLISRAGADGVHWIVDSSRPDSWYYNRAVIGPSVTSLADVVGQIPASVQGVELLIPQQTESNFSCLQDAGYVPLLSLCYLGADPKPPSAVERRVTELRPDHRDSFFDLLELSGASFPAEKRRSSQQFYCTEEFRSFVAYDSNDAPAGWATMYVHAGTAFLANAYTLPQYRGHGFHSALLAARLNVASELGLEQAYSDVQPASQSHRNCMRAGFRLLSVNNIWKRTQRVV